MKILDVEVLINCCKVFGVLRKGESIHSQLQRAAPHAFSRSNVCICEWDQVHSTNAGREQFQ